MLRYGVPVSGKGLRGEAHFGWVMEGRAMQDVWIMPSRRERAAGMGTTFNMYGTTLRIWDEGARAWRVTYVNAVTGRRDELMGRRSGKDVVQTGVRADGTPIRWRFTEIGADSFRWTGEVLEADGETWRMEGEFLARRIEKKEGEQR